MHELDNEYFVRRFFIFYKKSDKWCVDWERLVHYVTTNDNEWQRVVQRVVQQVTTNDNKFWFQLNFFFFK